MTPTRTSISALIGDDEADDEEALAVLAADGAETATSETAGPDDGDTEDGTGGERVAIDDEADGVHDDSPQVYGDDDAIGEWAVAAE
ncbi:hypothetical protein [Sphingobium sp. DC-2]|uniref:hypothetical protein n=1 Tax=Sphingobium sp. DC-2 TaxID=1303256 RepID=UPI0004C357D8|nr:hypothetical protein [Sphingobium sp. DC-2]